jgi:hypothetical protein
MNDCRHSRRAIAADIRCRCASAGQPDRARRQRLSHPGRPVLAHCVHPTGESTCQRHGRTEKEGLA